ncbi:protein SMAX1-LIKE 3 [Arachis duranensis]|uniref:Protein SMAX1-LIKE 3 n=1 Tax=Arachis duranensis TaxID=130453 RepID=A0A6P4CGY0_ARADU|nr:protein SMAX1-LIKE 3 [Arachis duranensis]
MRTGSCSVQQGLTPEAASIVKQAVTLAKRRGHAQVTPLHVANTMLSDSNGLLRTACLQSHSHPLQCKALELCFNVALNRLPASTSSPMLGNHHHPHHSQCPSISNAMVAAFKRAQAHQRRGSIENQQQPLLAVKIELEQLIISILDDPSVSRVMKEAGFSSTQVKSNVEQAVSLEICSQNNNTNNKNNNKSKDHKSDGDDNNNNNNNKVVLDPVRDEDVSSVIDNLVSQRRRTTVIVGECVKTLEGVVRRVMEKFEKGQVSESLRGIKFLPLSLSSFSNLSRLEVEQKIEELNRSLVNNDNNDSNKGCVLYLGDLKWVFDYYRDQGMSSRVCYSPVDHMIMEIAKMVSSNNNNNNGRFWLMGIATFQAYMRCKNGHPSMENLWGLHPITIPAGSLSLSLITDSGLQNQAITNSKADNRTSWLLLDQEGRGGGVRGDINNDLGTFLEPSSSSAKVVENEVRSLQSMNSTCNSDSSSSLLPAWLQQYKNENKGLSSSNHQDVQVGEVSKTWNNATQKQPYTICDQTLTLSSPSSSNTSSVFFYDHHPNPNNINYIWNSENRSNRNHSHSQNHNQNNDEPALRVYISNKEIVDHSPLTISPLSNPSSSNPNSTSSSGVMEAMEYVNNKFKELNLENLKNLCNALENKVPWQKEILPEIASTILQCRSGTRQRRKGNNNNNNVMMKEETWLFFQGVDLEAKEKIAMELARVVFGSSKENFISISMSSFSSSTRADSSIEDNNSCRNKRSREDPSCSYIARFGEAVCSNPHRVFLVEDIEQADYFSQLGFKRAMERGKVEDSNGEEVSLCDAIIILSCESFSSRSRACSPLTRQKSCEGSSSREDNTNHNNNNDYGDGVATLEEISPCVSLDLDLNISIDDDECNDDHDDHGSVDEIGLLESVDGKVFFKIQDL